MKNVIVYAEEGKFCGWPANNGVWVWDGREILVGLSLGDYVVKDGHNVDQPTIRSVVCRSMDGGESWSPVTLDDALIEPVCQASAIRFTDETQHDRNRLLFSNPASTEREQMTVRVSYDEGRTWTDGAVLHNGPAAYSDLCVARDLRPVCLYERGVMSPYETITFAAFSLQWLTAGRDSVSR